TLFGEQLQQDVCVRNDAPWPRRPLSPTHHMRQGLDLEVVFNIHRQCVDAVNMWAHSHQRLVHADAIAPHNSRWHAHHHAVIRYVFDHNRVGTNHHIVADTYPAEHFGTGANHHVIAERWTIRGGSVANRYLLTNQAVDTDHVGGHHRAETVLDE